MIIFNSSFKISTSIGENNLNILKLNSLILQSHFLILLILPSYFLIVDINYHGA